MALALAVFTYLLFPASPAVDFPVYEVGSVASDNVIAPFAFSVPKSDAELSKERDAAAATVEPVFDFVPGALDSTRRQLAAFAQAVNGAAAAADPRNVVIGIQQAAASQGVDSGTGAWVCLSELLERPINIISVGPDRAQTIFS